MITENKALLAYIHDILMAGFSLIIAIALQTGLNNVSTILNIILNETLLYNIALYVLIAGITFRKLNMYRGIWRYASVTDAFTIIKAVSISIFIFAVVSIFINKTPLLQPSTFIIQWLCLTLMLSGSRLAYRILRDHYFSPPHNLDSIPVILVGTGDGAELFCRTVLSDSNCKYQVTAILDDRGYQTGRSIHGFPILGYYTDLKSVFSQLKEKGTEPKRLIFTENYASGKYDIIKNMAHEAEDLGLMLSRMPSPTEFKEGLDDGQVNLRPIAIEDILGRPQASLDIETIKEFIKGKSILITGAGGSIGSELVRQITSFSPKNVTLIDNCEYNLYKIDHEINNTQPLIKVKSLLCDIRDKGKIDRIFKAEIPEIVFHAAALKHVPLVELNPAEGILTNVLGTRNVANAALHNNAIAFVQVSTDKAVNPTNIMGATKRLAEYYCQALDLKGQYTKSTRFMTVRFGNVLGSSGSVVPLFKEQIKNGGPITVTHPDMKRFFMTIKEAVGLILQSSAFGVKETDKHGRIFVLDMGDPIKIVDVAKRMINLANLELDKDISIAFTALRPGEKLFEELFDVKETPIKTNMPSVMAAIPQPIEAAVLQRGFEQLEIAAHKDNVHDIIRLISNLVPGFTTNDKTISENDKDTKNA